MTSSPPSPARFAGLDGLRAVAVATVLLYHLFPTGAMAGGFVGVDVFFIISGFLITMLLLRERAAHGRIRLRAFWIRRARRLLPALAAVIAVCAALAWLVGGDVLAGIGVQIAGAATFSFNWVSLAGGEGYFAEDTPELFRNLWSLAVEEQFYVVWPLLLPLLLVVRRTAVRVTIALAAAAASAAWMATLVVTGAVTRAYFGTDAHAFGLLLGVALALALHPALADPPEWMRDPRWRRSMPAVGLVAVAGILLVAALPATATPLTFPGALLLAGVFAAVAVLAGVWPGSRFGAMLDLAPLRWVGDRSYALYLWHWPLLVLATGGVVGSDAEIAPETGLGVLVLTVVAAELSYRFVEMPVRRLGFRGAARAFIAGFTRGPVRRLTGILTALVVVGALGGTTAAIASAPHTTSAEDAVAAGRAALERQSSADTTRLPSPPSSAPEVAPVDGAQITAVGDSVMLASAPALMERLPGVVVDAAVSRSMYAAPGILRSLADAGQLRPYVVVALGTNGPIERDTLTELRSIVGPERDLVLVTAAAPRDWIPGVNEQLVSFSRQPGVEIADWATAISGHEDLLAGDRIHPGDAGGEIFADAVAGAVEAAAAQRAEAEWRREAREASRDRLPQPR
jgi:peptidoglycan/LPS O-acetylase OafA/YrhL